MNTFIVATLQFASDLRKAGRFAVGMNNARCEDAANDQRRLFAPLKAAEKKFDFLKFLASHGISHSDYVVGKVAYILTLAGCLPQMEHTDYKAGKWNFHPRPPLNVLIALTEREYVVCPSSHLLHDSFKDAVPITVALNPGDVIVTCGDVLHHGGGNKLLTDAFALHAYIDNPTLPNGKHSANSIHVP